MKMQIETLTKDRMNFTGKKLLELMQNTKTPVLDLLVREVIQNSLDAAIGGTEFVEMNFIIDKFNSLNFSSFMEDIDKELCSRFQDKEYDFLAIRDYNCVGLKGEFLTDDVTDTKNNNLHKLVYDAMNPQRGDGAGGSWGIGKTVYYRLGIGIIIYYSRILKDDNTHESRLVASLAENEEVNKNERLLKCPGNRGIAFFGKKVSKDSKKTIPITSENYIEKFLKVFNIQPYKDNETGTTVIIPYIDEGKLLLEFDMEPNKKPYWSSKTTSLLEILVQKWYFPRLENKSYNGPYLKAKVNGKEIKNESMEPYFKILQKLYNYAISPKEDFEEHNINSKVIDLNSLFGTAGKFVFGEFDIHDLKMDDINGYEDPYTYIGFHHEKDEYDRNPPIVMYTRKPGMIISYEVGKKPWVHEAVSSNNDKYILGIFVLDSNSKLKVDNSSLEEYARKTEKADHESWYDLPQKDIIYKIQTHIRNALRVEYVDAKEDDKEAKIKKNLAIYFGKMLLPPEDYGNEASRKHPKITSTIIKKTKGINVSFGEPTYARKEMMITIHMDVKKKYDSINLSWMVATESKNLSIEEWENMGFVSPIKLKSVGFRLYKFGNEKYKDKNWFKFFYSSSDFKLDNFIVLNTLQSSKENIYCLKIKPLKNEIFKADIELRFEIIDNSVQTDFHVATLEAKNE